MKNCKCVSFLDFLSPLIKVKICHCYDINFHILVSIFLITQKHHKYSELGLHLFSFSIAKLQTNPLVWRWEQFYSKLVFMQIRWGSGILVLIHLLLITKLEVLPPGTKLCSLRCRMIVLPLHQLCAVSTFLQELRRPPEDTCYTLKDFTVQTWNPRNTLARWCEGKLRRGHLARLKVGKALS